MKKLSLIISAVLIAAATFAQTTSGSTSSINPETEQAQMKKLRADVRAYNDTKAEAKTAIIKGDMTTAKTLFAAAKADKLAIKAEAAVLKSEGVAHAAKTARKQIRKEDNMVIKTDIKNLMAAKAARQQAIKAGDITAAQTARADIKADKQELKNDIREARRDDKKRVVVLRVR